MTLTRRNLLCNFGLGVAAAAPLMMANKAAASEYRVYQLIPPRTKPRIRPRRDYHQVPSHHKSVVPHLPKHHKHKHHARKHVGAENMRAFHTLTTPGDRHDLALTMWGEARGHGELGMICVGNVVLNRVAWDHHATGHGIHGVCRKRKQFSCWNKGDPNRERMRVLPKLSDDHPDWKAWVMATRLAGRLLANAITDNVHGATYYCAKSIVPYWVGDMTELCIKAGHIFYKPKRHKHKHHKYKRHCTHRAHHLNG